MSQWFAFFKISDLDTHLNICPVIIYMWFTVMPLGRMCWLLNWLLNQLHLFTVAVKAKMPCTVHSIINFPTVKPLKSNTPVVVFNFPTSHICEGSLAVTGFDITDISVMYLLWSCVSVVVVWQKVNIDFYLVLNHINLAVITLNLNQIKKKKKKTDFRFWCHWKERNDFQNLSDNLSCWNCESTSLTNLI